MKVDKAIFGQVNLGHGLKCCSSNDKLFNNASHFLDLPDAVPPGVNLSSYISGFALQGYYIIARTFLDKSANRAGMVISYALAVPIDDIQNLENINQLLTLLPDVPVSDHGFCSEYSNIDLTDHSSQQPTALNHNVAELMVSKENGPIIHVGFVGFEELVASVWHTLWPSMRGQFSFRLSLSPKDCMASNIPSLVCIPTSLLSRWQYCSKLINTETTAAPLTSAATALVNGYEKYSDLCRNFEIDLEKPSKISFMVQAFDIYSNNISQLNLVSCLNLVRLIGNLSPANTKGINHKSELVSQLVALVLNTDVNNILRLRNMSEHSFQGLENLWDAVRTRLENCQFSTEDDDIVIQIITNSFKEEKAVDAWRGAVHTAFERIFTVHSSPIYSAIWRWLPSNFEVTDQLLEHVSLTSFFEDRMKSSAPNQISQEVAAVALPFFAKRKFLQLHALVLAQCYPVHEALLVQLKVDRSNSSSKGLAIIVSQSSSDELLAACLSISNERITNLTIEQAVVNPLILKNVNFSSKNSLFIWAKVMERNSSTWKAPQKSQDILFSLLNDLISSGSSTNIALLQLLSTTPLADLCEFPQRSNIWRLLDGNIRSNYLSRTAVGWYDRALQQEFLDLDDELDKVVSQIPALLKRIHQAYTADTTVILEIFKQVKSLTESDFLIWLDGYVDNIEHQTTNNLMIVGKLIQDRCWEASAKLAFDNRHKSLQNVKTILMCCNDLLSLWDRFVMGFQNNDQKWQALTEVMQELYGSGPEDQEIWVRSGGKLGKIPTNKTGSEAWVRVIRKIRSGAKPFPEELLTQVKKDFPKNRQVNILYDLFGD